MPGKCTIFLRETECFRRLSWDRAPSRMTPCSVAAVSEIPDSVGHPVLRQENAVLLAEVHQRSSLYDAEDGDPQREEGSLTLN